MKTRLTNPWLAMLASAGLVVLHVACGGGDSSSPTGPAAPSAPAAPSSSPTSLGTVDASMVGTWVGPMDGSGGPATHTLVLRADGTMRASGSIAFYNPPANGNWGVSGAQFRASGVSGPGLTLTFEATVAGNTMSGTWTGSNGTAGTFSGTKQ
jgi:hypothetical protein